MSIGPCLCGDPYCPSCGDPQAAKMEEAYEILLDELHEMRLTEHEFECFKNVGLAAIRAMRKEVDNQVADARMADGMYIDELEQQVEDLREQVGSLQQKIIEGGK